MKFKTTYNYILLSPLLVEFFLIVPSVPPTTKNNYLSLISALLLFVAVIWVFYKTNVKNSIVMEDKSLLIPYDLNANEIGRIPYVLIMDAKTDPQAAGKHGIVLDYMLDYSMRSVIFRVQNENEFLEELTKRTNRMRNKECNSK
ncbi:MAG: hypothetical protein RR641_01325 [Erysipelotrichaceae bacterium]